MKKISKNENSGNISKTGKIKNSKKIGEAQTQKITAFFKNIPNSSTVVEVELEKGGLGVEHTKRFNAIKTGLRKLPELSTLNSNGTNYDGGGGGEGGRAITGGGYRGWGEMGSSLDKAEITADGFKN